MGRPLGLSLATALLLAGCAAEPALSGEERSPEPSSPSVSSVGAEVIQYRRDEQRDVVQVKVTNDGSLPLHVSGVRLDTTTFVEPVSAPKDSTVAPGRAVDLVVPIGDPDCRPDPEAEHLVTLSIDGQETTLPVEGDVLERIAARRCALVAVRQQVGLATSPEWTPTELSGEPGVTGTLLVTPQPGSGALTVTVEGATTLFTIAEPASTGLPPEAEPYALPVRLTMTRCDAHAIAEDKKGYLLPVRVAVDGSEAVLVEVAVPVPDRAALQALIDRAC